MPSTKARRSLRIEKEKEEKALVAKESDWVNTSKRPRDVGWRRMTESSQKEGIDIVESPSKKQKKEKTNSDSKKYKKCSDDAGCEAKVTGQRARSKKVKRQKQSKVKKSRECAVPEVEYFSSLSQKKASRRLRYSSISQESTESRTDDLLPCSSQKKKQKTKPRLQHLPEKTASASSESSTDTEEEEEYDEYDDEDNTEEKSKRKTKKMQTPAVKKTKKSNVPSSGTERQTNKGLFHLWNLSDDEAETDPNDSKQKENAKPGETELSGRLKKPKKAKAATQSGRRLEKYEASHDASSDALEIDISQWEAIEEQSAVSSVRRYKMNTSSLVWIKTGKNYYAEPREKNYDWRPGYILTESERQDLDLPEPLAGNVFCRLFDDCAFYPWDAPKEIVLADTRPFGPKMTWNLSSRQALERKVPQAEFAAIFDRGALLALRAAKQDTSVKPILSQASTESSTPSLSPSLRKDLGERRKNKNFSLGLEEDEAEVYDYSDELRPILIEAVGRPYRRLIDLILEPKLFSYRQARTIVESLDQQPQEGAQHKDKDTDSILAQLKDCVDLELIEHMHSEPLSDILRTAEDTLKKIQEGTLVSHLRQLECGNK